MLLYMAGINQPIKTDITFTDILQVGGTATEILDQLKTKEYKYLKTDNNIIFELNHFNTKTYEKLKYLGKGSFTVVFSIEMTSDRENKKNWNDKYNFQLILRVTTGDSENIVKKYLIDKPIFQNNLIDIYLYGQLKILGKNIGYYTITRYYETDFTGLDITGKIKIIKDYFNVLIKSHKLGIFYRDQKYQNIGYEKVGDNYNFIILDYDEYTLVNLIHFYRNSTQLGKQITHGFFGTFIPNYLLNFKLQNKKKEFNEFKYYDKLYAAGSLDILANILNFHEDFPSFFLNYIYIASKEDGLDPLVQTNEMIQKIKTKYGIDFIDNKIGGLNLDITKIFIDKNNTISTIFNYFIGYFLISCMKLDYKEVPTIAYINNYVDAIDYIFLNILCKVPEISNNIDVINTHLSALYAFNYFFKIKKLADKVIEVPNLELPNLADAVDADILPDIDSLALPPIPFPPLELPQPDLRQSAMDVEEFFNNTYKRGHSAVSPSSSPQNPPDKYRKGGSFFNKYLKYKHKYLSLKNDKL